MTDRFRERLEGERDDLVTQLRDMGIDPESGKPDAVAFDEGFADSGQATAEKARILSIADGLHETLVEVKQALGRIDDGTYGTCATCGNAIPVERLEARPFARFCLDCKQRG